MKKLYKLFSCLVIQVFMFAFMLNANANDTITFTWKGGINKQFQLNVPTYNPFTIHWGDDSTETITPYIYIHSSFHTYSDTNNYTVNIIGNSSNFMRFYCTMMQLSNINISNCPAVFEIDCSNNQLNILDINKNIALRYLDCSNNQLNALNTSKNTALHTLYCYNNQLNALDISENTALRTLNCSNNQLNVLDISKNIELFNIECYSNSLPLSELYAISVSMNITNNKKLGSQFLFVQQVMVGDTINFSSQARFNTTNTVFDVFKNGSGMPIPVGIDYTINNGIITFINAGNYTVSMRNTAIFSHPSYPVAVLSDFVVRDANTDATLSNLSISKGKLTPVFHSDTLNYVVNVEYEIKEIQITAIQTDTNATINGDTGFHQLTIGANHFVITVTAEDKITTLNYTITITRKDTIIDTTDITDIKPSIFGISVFPNPTAGQLIIKNYELKDGNIQIFDVAGCNVEMYPYRRSENGEMTIDVSHLVNGIYFLKVENRIVKFIKN